MIVSLRDARNARSRVPHPHRAAVMRGAPLAATRRRRSNTRTEVRAAASRCQRSRHGRLARVSPSHRRRPGGSRPRQAPTIPGGPRTHASHVHIFGQRGPAHRAVVMARLPRLGPGGTIETMSEVDRPIERRVSVLDRAQAGQVRVGEVSAIGLSRAAPMLGAAVLCPRA
jgi:hypothetical protein